MIRSLLSFIVCLVLAISVSAQDIHYSQFFNSPLNLNPGLTGVFNGNQRLHASMKRQWFPTNDLVGYQTFSAGFDWKLLKDGKPNFFSVGALFNHDRAGDLRLSHNGIQIFGSYTMKLSGKSFLTPGVNVGYVGRSADASAIITSSSIFGGNLDALIPNNNADISTSFLDLNAGVNYRWQTASRKFFDLGAGVFHLNSPEENFFTGVNYSVNRPLKLNLYAMINWQLASKVDLLLNGLYSSQGEYQETVVNAQGKIYLNDTNNTALFFGVGGRFGDAWHPMVAVSFENWYASFGYDINSGSFNEATNGRGGIEFHIRYLISKVPNPLYKPCPIY